MPPRILTRAFEPWYTTANFSSQWSSPTDVFSVLLLLGGDVVQVTLAQISGWGISPVAFSFGWVAYAVNAVVSAVGECKLLPPTDCPCTVINAKSGYSRQNSSWVLGRLVRDYEHWCDPRVRTKVDEVIKKKWTEQKVEAIERGDHKRAGEISPPSQAGLVVSFYRADGVGEQRVYDKVFLSGMLIIPIQLGIAAIPFALYGNWSIFFIVACGTALAIGTGALPQWAKEKWSCRRRDSKKTFILTRGQGSQHAIVITDEGSGFDLEDLAAEKHHGLSLAGLYTQITVASLALCWVLLLIAAAGIRGNTWYLLGVGALGMAQNIYVAGAPRRPETSRIMLTFEDVVGDSRVKAALVAAETHCPGAGFHLIKEFFPTGLREDELIDWNERFPKKK